MSLRVAAATLATWATWAGVAMGLGERPAQAGEGTAWDLLRFAPPDSAAAIRGREVALRFGLGRRFELTLQVNNAFSAQNRQAIARAEAAIADVPGVRGVIGPAELLVISLDPAGRPSSGPLLGGGADEDASETVRQRLIRRSDAIGWFVSRDGTEIRLLVDTDNPTSVSGAVEAAAASSGLVLLSGGIPASPLWPEPDRDPRPFPAWLPFALLALALAPGALGMAVACRPTLRRGLWAATVAGVAAAAPAMLAPASGLRHVAVWSGVGTTVAILGLILGRVALARGARGGRPRFAPRFVAIAMILVPSGTLMIGALALWSRVTMGTQLWHETDVFFVEVRGDMDEPVVLREVRRLTDFLRGEPGVAHAWSVADLFFAVPEPGESFGTIPSSAELVRSILARAREDSAVRLELAPDHRGGLVGVRLDGESGVDRLAVLDRLSRYLVREHRPAVLRVDLSDPAVSPALRGLGRGILAADTRERVLRICARAGRILSDDDVQSIEHAARRAALLPAVDPARLRTEIARETSAFLQEAARASPQIAAAPAPDRKRLVDELSSEPIDASVSDVTTTLRHFWGEGSPEPLLRARAIELRRRLAAVRRSHIARINFTDILYGADLPTEGVLSEEVRDATLAAMGPIAAVPVSREVPGAFIVDAVPVGGVACDRALSQAWLPMLALGVAISLVVTALVLLIVGGAMALVWWPPACAPAASLVVVAAVAAVPVGALYVALLAGALAGGAVLALAAAPGRRDR